MYKCANAWTTGHVWTRMACPTHTVASVKFVAYLIEPQLQAVDQVMNAELKAGILGDLSLQILENGLGMYIHFIICSTIFSSLSTNSTSCLILRVPF